MKKRFTFIGLLLIVTTLAGCAYTPPPVPDLVWPLPPDEPRIKYVAAYKSINDFPKTSGERLKDVLFGSDVGPLFVRKPNSVATDSRGRIFVCDTALGGVLVIDPPNRRMDLWGQDVEFKLSLPLGVTVDSRDNVYVADGKLKRILIYNNSGKLIYTFGGTQDFTNPAGIALDEKRNHLVVADSKAHKVKIFDLKGKFIKEITGSGQAGGNFYSPTNVAVDKQGNIYVVDTLNFRVQVFDQEGKFLRIFGQVGDAYGNLIRPKGIAVDSEGHIYVVDAAIENFQIFDQEGRLLLFVGTGGVRYGEFSIPYGIWIDKEDKIYVTDQVYNPRVQVFQYLKKK